ncbi:hypothetical protein AB1Y20_017681 [Prymnesium parvum]|uniref:Uncharacterized protein n=1 Tax=Prymnesium parvum TaxID=97485 RepID=A0AB34JL82_PRYPA
MLQLALLLLCAPAALSLRLPTAPRLQLLSNIAPSTHPAAHAATAVAPFLASLPLAAGADDGTGYSQVSFYFTLVLYILSFPGLYSLVTRSVKSKVVRRTYEVAGPAADGGRPVRETAGDIVAFFQANNYRIADASDVIVFEGTQAGQTGRAAFLTFCTFVGLGSLALVLTIFEQAAFGEGNGLGNIWYASTLLSPLAGKYYLDNAERTDRVTVKIVTEDDEMSSDVIVQGDEEEVDRFQKTLDMREKGMVYVKGILN